MFPTEPPVRIVITMSNNQSDSRDQWSDLDNYNVRVISYDNSMSVMTVAAVSVLETRQAVDHETITCLRADTRHASTYRGPIVRAGDKSYSSCAIDHR